MRVFIVAEDNDSSIDMADTIKCLKKLPKPPTMTLVTEAQHAWELANALGIPGVIGRRLPPNEEIFKPRKE